MIDLSKFGEGVTPHLYNDMQAVAGAAAAQILKMAAESISARGAFHLVVAGGTTPKLTYQLLLGADTDWKRWHIYYGDERCLPADDPERNSVMVRCAWLDHVPIPKNQHHPIPAELGAEEGAAVYSAVIEKVKSFDMVLLGMGEDGHTASLFPGQFHNEHERVHAVHNAPKPPSDRISLSRFSLINTRQLLLLVTGFSKQEALIKWTVGDPLPVVSIMPDCGLDLLLDTEAVGIVK